MNKFFTWVFLSALLVPLFAGGNSRAMAAEYVLEVRQMNPDGPTQTEKCVEDRDLCFLTMTLPLDKENLDIGAIFSAGVVRIQFRIGEDYLSISKQGREFLYETVMDNEGKSVLKKTIGLYFINPVASHDPEIPSLLVARPPNKMAATIEINIRFPEIKIDSSP